MCASVTARVVNDPSMSVAIISCAHKADGQETAQGFVGFEFMWDLSLHGPFATSRCSRVRS